MQEAPRAARSFFPINRFVPSSLGRMSEALFDSDLSYQDAVENVYAWKKQAIVGSATIRGTPCQILESKPDAPSDSTYARVRSWIDPVRLVPLRLEKYSSSGDLVRQIDITRLSRNEKGRWIPATIVVHGPRKNTVTEFNGARIDRAKRSVTQILPQQTLCINLVGLP